MNKIALILVLLIASCLAGKKNTMTKPISSTFDVQGHRGCRGLMPENTIAAMLKAMDFGVTTLELDVSITRDSICILSHEPFFNHEISTKPGGALVQEAEEKSLNIFTMDYATVQTFDVGLRPHPRFPEQQKMAAQKPTLTAVFDAVKAYCTVHNRPMPFFNIETKTLPETDGIFHPEPNRFVRLLMAVIEKAKVEKLVMIQSFDFRTLKIIHEKYPAIETAALVEDFDKIPFAQQMEKLGFTPTVYSPAQELVTPQLVKQCHERGIKLIPWTVNDTATAQKLKTMGVDGFITDYPDRIR